MTTGSRLRFLPAAAFWSSALVLVLAALFADPVIAGLRKYYTKLTIEIKVPLAEFDDSRMPSYERIPVMRNLFWVDQDIETDEKATIALRRVEPLPSGIYPEAALHLAYYSDPMHQVAHTPEVCFRQDGGIINQVKSVDVEIPELGTLSPVRARLVDIQRAADARIIDLYLFISNGRFYHDRDRLRLALGMPGDRYTYFCKVEVAVVRDNRITDEEARQVAQEVLREAIPILLQRHLPTREEVSRR
jgi:hypothetical protein